MLIRRKSREDASTWDSVLAGSKQRLVDWQVADPEGSDEIASRIDALL